MGLFENFADNSNIQWFIIILTHTHTYTHLGPWCCLKAKKYHLRRVSNCGSIWGPNKPGRSTFWLVFDLWCDLHEVEFQEPEVRGPQNNCGRIIYTCGKVTIKSVDNPFESDVFKQVKSWWPTFLRGYISLYFTRLYSPKGRYLGYHPFIHILYICI